MNLNNKGFGLKEMIIYTCLLILLLVFVSLSIDSFYKSNSVEKDNSKENQAAELYHVDFEYYRNLEETLRLTTKRYLENNKAFMEGEKWTVTVEELIEQQYLSGLYDQTGHNVCTGYSNGYLDNNNEFIVVPYLKCSNYVTNGYMENEVTK